jgi:hypothetical protein
LIGLRRQLFPSARRHFITTKQQLETMADQKSQ